MTSAQGGPTSQHTFQAPTGTRDFYPAELSRLRYVQDAWRKTSINHGFEEIDGPTFEHLDLYTVKSGEGIVSELFSFERFGGEKKFALRPEFTPTLARLYAAKANALPKPTKWFWMQNCFRAERPQRGRLREFCQWNCDIVGAESNEPESLARVDAELIACAVGCLQALGLGPDRIRVRINSRSSEEARLRSYGVANEQLSLAFTLLDRRDKAANEHLLTDAQAAGLTTETFLQYLVRPRGSISFSTGASAASTVNEDFQPFAELFKALDGFGIADWCDVDFNIARGLAYYTGMVFEIRADGERAIAGGGRYDKLIEMFGGPPTPAVGFGMGDVVLSLVLQDKGLFPTDDAIANKLGLRPDVFVISNGQPEADAQVAPMLAQLRREGLHARRTYKATKNVGKLIGDAVKARARFALIIESATTGQLKNLTTQAQEPVEMSQVASRVRS